MFLNGKLIPNTVHQRLIQLIAGDETIRRKRRDVIFLLRDGDVHLRRIYQFLI